jgi:hypothetical protein
VLELVRDGGVGARARRGQVPGAAIRVSVARQRLGQREMDALALAEAGAAVHGRAHQWVPEAQCGAVHADEVRGLQPVERLHVGAEQLGPAQHGGQIAAVVRGRQQQELLRLRVERADPPEKGPLEALPHRQRLDQRLAPGELFGAQRRRQLDQRKRVSLREGQQPVVDRLGQRRPGAVR